MDVKGGCAMKAKQAVAVRVLELCKERNITVNTLANMAGI